MNKILFLFLFGCIFSVFSQRQYSKEFSLINDNDLYISLKQDRYYTNGTFLTYRYLSKKATKKTIKKIYNLQIGQLIFAPFTPIVQSITSHDRPFAGYLYGKFGIDYFYSNNSTLKLSSELGILGPNAFASETMEFIHDIYGFQKAIGWKHQIHQALGFNLNIEYTKHLGVSNSKKLDISWFNSAKIGTIFTDISTGLYGRVSFFNPLQNVINSIAFGSNLNNKSTILQNEPEAFFYIKPTISLIGYDATIEGSIFNSTSPVTYDIEPLKFVTEFGVRFTANNFNFGYSVIYHTKKLKSIRVPEGNFYGSIQVNYQFN